MNKRLLFLRAFAFTVISLFASESQAIFAIVLQSGVQNTVLDEGQGVYRYDYTLSFADTSLINGNWGFSITSFSVPYFNDASIGNITSPSGWSYQILNQDSFNLGNGAETLVWSTAGAGLFPDFCNLSNLSVNGWPANCFATLSGFGYSASFMPVAGPYNVSGVDYNYSGDPAVPGSPEAIADGLNTPVPLSSVPVPNSVILLAGGFIGLAFAYRLKGKSAIAFRPA